jgi:cupin 2 domain-containing protein
MTNIFADLPSHLPEELTQTLLHANDLRIERIISRGHSSPSGFWYDQDEDEWVIVLRGAAKIQFEDRAIEMNPGDYLHIPARHKHCVQWTAPDELTIWLAVFYRAQGESMSDCSQRRPSF